MGLVYDVNCLNVVFTNTSSESEGNGGPIVETIWDFGDGNMSNLKDAVHNYEEMGTYKVLLEIRDQSGITDTLSRVIEVGCTDVEVVDLPTLTHTIYPNPVNDIFTLRFLRQMHSNISGKSLFSILSGSKSTR